MLYHPEIAYGLTFHLITSVDLGEQVANAACEPLEAAPAPISAAPTIVEISIDPPVVTPVHTIVGAPVEIVVDTSVETTLDGSDVVSILEVTPPAAAPVYIDTSVDAAITAHIDAAIDAPVTISTDAPIDIAVEVPPTDDAPSDDAFTPPPQSLVVAETLQPSVVIPAHGPVAVAAQPRVKVMAEASIQTDVQPSDEPEVEDEDEAAPISPPMSDEERRDSYDTMMRILEAARDSKRAALERGQDMLYVRSSSPLFHVH